MAFQLTRTTYRNASYTLRFFVDNGGGNIEAAPDAGLQVKMYKAGAGAVNLGSPTHLGGGELQIAVTASQMTTTEDAIVFSYEPGESDHTSIVDVNFYPCLDSGMVAATTGPDLDLRSGAPSTNDIFNGASVAIVRGPGLGQVRTITDYDGSNVRCTLDRAWDTNPTTSSVYCVDRIPTAKQTTAAIADVNVVHINELAAAADALAALYKGGTTNATVNDATPTTTMFTGSSALVATADWYNNMLLVFTTGALAGFTAMISDYSAARVVTLVAATPVAPANGDEFVILGRVI